MHRVKLSNASAAPLDPFERAFSLIDHSTRRKSFDSLLKNPEPELIKKKPPPPIEPVVDAHALLQQAKMREDQLIQREEAQTRQEKEHSLVEQQQLFDNIINIQKSREMLPPSSKPPKPRSKARQKFARDSLDNRLLEKSSSNAHVENEIKTPTRKKFTNSSFMMGTGNNLINSIINSTAVVTVESDKKQSSAISPQVVVHSRRRRSTFTDLDQRRSSMEEVAPVVHQKHASKPRQKPKSKSSRRRSFDHFTEAFHMKKEEDDHHEAFESLNHEEKVRKFLSGNHTKIAPVVATEEEEKVQEEEKLLVYRKINNGGQRRESHVFLPTAFASLPPSRDSTPPKRRLSLDNIKDLVKQKTKSLLKSASDHIYLGRSGYNEKKEIEKQKRNFATLTIQYFLIYHVNRKRRKWSVRKIQKCYRGWRSWIILEKWRITVRLEQEKNKQQSFRETRASTKAAKKKHTAKKAVKMAGIKAAGVVGYVHATKQERREAARARFSDTDDAILIAVHYKFGWPTKKSERDPAWQEYKKVKTNIRATTKNLSCLALT